MSNSKKSNTVNRFFFWHRSKVTLPPAPPPCDPNSLHQARATEFQIIDDREATTSFTRMDRSNIIQWAIIAKASSDIHKINSHKAIINLLRQGKQYCLGFPVNNMEHCLQTATRAVRDNASDELVLAALLHDAAIAISYPGHAQIAAAIIRPYVSEGVYQTVLHHEEFALAHYGHLIGQPTDMRLLYASESWYNTAANFVDNWVQKSYDPNYDTMPLKEFKPLIKEKFAPHDPAEMESTMSDCFTESTP